MSCFFIHVRFNCSSCTCLCMFVAITNVIFGVCVAYMCLWFQQQRDSTKVWSCNTHKRKFRDFEIGSTKNQNGFHFAKILISYFVFKKTLLILICRFKYINMFPLIMIKAAIMRTI